MLGFELGERQAVLQMTSDLKIGIVSQRPYRTREKTTQGLI
jgi:hypothetical protein